MLFSELLALVQDKVNRPDLTTEIDFRTLQAVRVVHMSLDFRKDLEEFLVPHASIMYQNGEQAIGKFTVPTDFRKLDVVWPRDATGTLHAVPLAKTTVSELAKLRVSRKDAGTYYEMGSVVSFKSAVAVQDFVISGYLYRPGKAIIQNPDGTQRGISDPAIANYTDWLLEEFPTAVADFAISYVAGAIGDGELRTEYEARFRTLHYPLLLNNQ